MRTNIFQTLSCLIAILTAMSLSCAGAPLSPAELASRRTVATSSRWSDGIQGIIRYNPARCECPEFEIRVDKAWYRVEITNKDEDPLLIELRGEATKAGPGWRAPVVATSRGIEKKKYRFPVIRLEILSLCLDGSCLEPGGDGETGRDVKNPD